LEELSMPRTKNECGGAEGGCGGVARKRRGVGAAKKNETHGYSVRDSVFLSFLKLMRPIVNETYFNFWASTTLKIT
jgi:hypothetical protein